MQNGTSVDPEIVLTPLNGFIGNVSLGATVQPLEQYGPAISLSKSTVFLNASQAGSQAYSMHVSTSVLTESGLYTVDVTGSSASISHSTTATVGVTSTPVPANGADLVYGARFSEMAFVNGSTVLSSTYENLGYVSLGIIDLTVTLVFGVYQGACLGYNFGVCIPAGSPFSSYVTVDPYKEETASFTIRIPGNISPGNYAVTIRVGWILNPGYLNAQRAPDLFAYGFLYVYPNPNPHPPPQQVPSPHSPPAGPPVYAPADSFAALGVEIFGAIVGVAVLSGVFILFLKSRKGRRNPLSTNSQSCSNCGAPRIPGVTVCDNCGLNIQ